MSFLGIYSKEIIKQKYIDVPSIIPGLFIIPINQTRWVLFIVELLNKLQNIQQKHFVMIKNEDVELDLLTWENDHIILSEKCR